MTQDERIIRALEAAGPRGLTWRELRDLQIVPARFIDTRMRDLARSYRIREEYGRRPSRSPRTGKPRPWRWVLLGERAPLVEPAPETEPRFPLRDEDVAAPVCALTADLEVA